MTARVRQDRPEVHPPPSDPAVVDLEAHRRSRAAPLPYIAPDKYGLRVDSQHADEPATATDEAHPVPEIGSAPGGDEPDDRTAPAEAASARRLARAMLRMREQIRPGAGS